MHFLNFGPLQKHQTIYIYILTSLTSIYTFKEYILHKESHPTCRFPYRAFLGNRWVFRTVFRRWQVHIGPGLSFGSGGTRGGTSRSGGTRSDRGSRLQSEDSQACWQGLASHAMTPTQEVEMRSGWSGWSRGCQFLIIFFVSNPFWGLVECRILEKCCWFQMESTRDSYVNWWFHHLMPTKGRISSSPQRSCNCIWFCRSSGWIFGMPAGTWSSWTCGMSSTKKLKE